MAQEGFDIDPFGNRYAIEPTRSSLGLQPPSDAFTLDTRPYDQMQATPRGFISGLFSDVLGGTLNMPSLPRTGIPSLDLFYMNRNPIMNMMGVGDVQKTAERISYGEPLTTGSGMTLKPREETMFAGMAVAPLVGEAALLGTRGVRTGARLMGQEIADRVATGRSVLPSVVAEPRPSLFAVEPSQMMIDDSSAIRQQLTAKMQALLAQKKLAKSAIEVGSINQQIGELQAQFKSLPAIQRVAREVVAPDITAPVSDLGFYSATEQAAMNLERSKGTGQAFLNDLMNAPDVKKDELSWIGLDDFLKDKPNVTKQEVQDFIANNKIDLQEVTSGAPITEDPIGIAKRKAIFDKYEPQITALYREMDNPSYVLISKQISPEEYQRGVVLQNRVYRGEPITAQEQAELDNILVKNEGAKVREFANNEEARNFYLSMSREDQLSHMIQPKFNSYKLQNQIDNLMNVRDAEADAAYIVPEPTPTKYSKYQLSGGENYREIRLTLPAKRELPSGYRVVENPSTASNAQKFIVIDDAGQRYGSGNTEQDALNRYFEYHTPNAYKSSHWNEPNVLAHMRVNDRIDADGKKMLLVEEIQSDWHQAGREKGYATSDINTRLKESEKELEKIGLQIRGLNNRMASLSDSQIDEFNKLADERQKLFDRQGFLIDEGNALIDKRNAGVPDAPFKDTWYQLALKRILKYAADNGYERVGLTTGKTQAERYDLSKQVDKIDVEAVNDVPNLFFVDVDVAGGRKINLEVENGIVRNDEFMGKPLKDVLGKEMADKILSVKQGNTQRFEDKDLRIGGEGMKKYYDEIYPKFLEKYGKKWGATVGETKINLHGDLKGYMPQDQMQVEPVRYIDITPKMKESIKKGQPLASAEQTPEMLASGGLNYADPFRNPLLESTIG